MEKNQLQEMCQRNGEDLPKYKLLSQGGLPNSPSFEVSVTVVWRGQELVEIASAVGKKKKDVEKMAAKKMIDRLKEMSNEAPGAVALPSERSNEQDSVRLSPGPSPKPDPPYSRPIPSPTSSHAKSELQELLQKCNYPLPDYTHLSPTGPSHKRQFTCKCVVIDNNNHVIHETQETGSTKKEAEMLSAREMLPVIKARLEGGGQLTPQGPSRIYRRTPPRDVADPTLDVHLSTTLEAYVPNFMIHEGIENKYLCLAVAEGACGRGQVPVTSYGAGDSKIAARREAELNLIHSLRELGYDVAS